MGAGENDIEVLKLLYPSSISPDNIPGGYGALTASDIAHALATIDDPAARLFARIAADHVPVAVLHRGEALYQDKLERLIRLRLHVIAKKGNWTIPKKRFMDMLIRLAVVEQLSGAQCMACNGQGEVMIQSKSYTCGSCKGSGIKGWTDAQRASYAGISERHFRRWRERYRVDICGIVGDFEGKIRKALRGV